MKIWISNRGSGFSLVEVVVAVGIFALAIVGVIGLLSPTNKAVADVRDNDDATRVAGAVQQHLQQLAENGAFTTTTSPAVMGIGSSTVSGNNGYVRDAAPADPADGTTFATNATYNTYTLYVSRDGGKLGIYNLPIWGTPSTDVIANKQKFFEVVLIRNSTLSANSSATTADTAAGYIAYTMRLRWPAFTGDGLEFTAHTQKGVLIVPGSVHR